MAPRKFLALNDGYPTQASLPGIAFMDAQLCFIPPSGGVSRHSSVSDIRDVVTTGELGNRFVSVL